MISHPTITLGNTWSDGKGSILVDCFGAGMVYHQDLKEILISLVAINFTFEIFCFEYTLEYLHHYFYETMGEDVCCGFEIAEEFMAIHFFGPEYLETFGFYEEGKEMITFEGKENSSLFKLLPPSDEQLNRFGIYVNEISKLKSDNAEMRIRIEKLKKRLTNLEEEIE